MNLEKFEIYKTFSASTAHVNESDINTLSYGNNFSSYSYEYGIRIYLDDDILNRIKIKGLSEGLNLIVIFALSNGCSYIELDSDGPIYDKLPVYDW
tara:strand:- start:1350 stop:1637 length:288 start_codon:yes stop_codon:yes gene_type:complete